jgi:hypothetical protein
MQFTAQFITIRACADLVIMHANLFQTAPTVCVCVCVRARACVSVSKSAYPPFVCVCVCVRARARACV